MEHFKLSTSRDFRINAASLQAALESVSSEGEEEDGEGGGEGGGEGAGQGRAAEAGDRQVSIPPPQHLKRFKDYLG